MIKRISYKETVLGYSKSKTNTGTYKTAIPKELIRHLELNHESDYIIKWYLDIDSEEIILKIVPKGKTTENTSVNIDEVTEKQIKTDETKTTTSESTIKEDKTKNITNIESTTAAETTITDPTAETNPIKYYEKMKKDKTHTKLNKDEIIRITIQKNQRAKELTFKFSFKIEKTKKEITRITIGSLTDSIQQLTELSKLDSKELSEYILQNTSNRNKKAVTEKLDELKDI